MIFKKLISLILCVMLVLAALPTFVFADVSPDGVSSGTKNVAASDRKEYLLCTDSTYESGEIELTAAEQFYLKEGSCYLISRIPMPEINPTSMFDSFNFNFSVRRKPGSTVSITDSEVLPTLMHMFKLPGDNWNLNELETSTLFQSCVNTANQDTYPAYDSIGCAYADKQTATSGRWYRVSTDISSYANECLERGQNMMYIATTFDESVYEQIEIFTGTSKVSIDVKAEYEFTPKQAPDLALVSKTINDDDVYNHENEISFTFNNNIKSALLTVNDENVNVKIVKNKVSIDEDLMQMEICDLALSVTDYYTHTLSQSVNFLTDIASDGSINEIKAYDISCELLGTTLKSFDFVLLTEAVSPQSYIKLINITDNDEVDADFDYNAENGKVYLVSETELEENKSYKVIIDSSFSDNYSNTLSDDLTVCMFATNSDFPTEGDETIFSSAQTEKYVTDEESYESYAASFDADGFLNVKYVNKYYRNSVLGVSVVNEASSQEVYFGKTNISDWGIAEVSGIPLSVSGRYKVYIYPQHRDAAILKYVDFFTDSDKEMLWDIATTSTSSGEIEQNWNNIEIVYEIGVDEILGYVSNDGGFYSKLANYRSGAYPEYNAQNLELLKSECTILALYTAVEQNTSSADIKILLPRIFELVDFSTNDVYLKWDGYVKSDCDNLMPYFVSMDKTINSSGGLIDAMEDALYEYELDNALAEFAKANHISQITTILNKHAELLGILSSISTYNALSSTTVADNMLLGETFDTLGEFQSAFTQALNAAVSDAGNNNNDITPAPAPSSPGGGSMVALNPSTTAPANTTPSGSASPFADLTGVDWAAEHIISLYNLGVISGKGNNTFAPNDNITREEIVKLIVALMNFEASDTAPAFNDVTPGSWYEAYVKTAYSLGIVKGMGNSDFGVGMSATRQDIAVMLLNALKAAGFELSEATDINFVDSYEISDYALDAVKALSSAGIITGDDMQRFNPTSNATRAEIAVMLSRIYNLFVKESR